MPLRDETGPVSCNFQIGAISAGDIVFVYDRSTHLLDKIVQFINVNGQRILAWVRKTERVTLKSRIHRYSHVMLGVGGGLIIHADGKTVAVEIISEAFHYETNEAALFQVYRRKGISQDIADKIVKSATRYYSQKYRFSSYFSRSGKSDTTQFCSRLVAHAYRSAGVPLTSRPDNRVLPVDLYQICQSDAWEDISADFVQEPLWSAADERLFPIEIPGQGQMTISGYLAQVDAEMLSTARLLKQRKESQYHYTGILLHGEAALAEYYRHQFESAKRIRQTPSVLDEKFAARIARVLQQLEHLLALSRLPTIELLVANTLLNADKDQTNISLYAGYPRPLTIREMQMAREAINVYSDLYFAEIGLYTILARFTQFEEFKKFRSVKSEYSDDFIAALQPVDDLSYYETGEDLFEWVEEESDRDTCRTVFRKIILALNMIETLRNFGSKSD